MPTALSAHLGVLACRDILFLMHVILVQDASITHCIEVYCLFSTIRNAMHPKPGCRVFSSMNVYQE